MKSLFRTGLLCVAAWPIVCVVQAEEENVHQIEEVLVTGLPIEQAPSESALPITVLSGDALRQKVSANLGGTLEQEPGLRSSTFGSGVGRPVIRGQSSTRVRVLQNGTGALDVSAVSPDHGNAVEPLVARQIEIIRGPATLLYGSGAIGGVVNVVDNRIPIQGEVDTSVFEYRHDTVNHSDTLVGVIDQYQDNFAWHIDFSLRDTSDTSIPGMAALHEEDHDEDVEEEEHEESTNGYIGNSQQESDTFAAGLNWFDDGSSVGLSVSSFKNNYGIPPGVHQHEDHEEEEAEHEAENIRLQLEQTRLEIKAEKEMDSIVKKLSIKGNYSDYEHSELSEHEEEGTVFKRQGYELNSNLLLDSQDTSLIGLHWQDIEFVSVGQEAYLPELDQQTFGIYGLYDKSWQAWTLEAGLRLEKDTLQSGNCEIDTNSWSASLSGIYEFSEAQQLVAGFTRSQRPPAMEEMFSNIDPSTCLPLEEPIAHFATGLHEIGNPNLKKERSSNLEVSYRKTKGDVHGEINLFSNQVADYIFLDIQESAEEPSAIFRQRDASFVGLEASVTAALLRWQNSHLDFSIGADYLEAEFKNSIEPGVSSRIPRIPPARVHLEFAWWSEHIHLSLGIAESFQQDKLAQNETITSAYTKVDIFAEYHWAQGSVFLKVNNLLDEEVRDHTSYIKDMVPEAGRGFESGLRIHF